MKSLGQHVRLLDLAIGMENSGDQSLTVAMFPLLLQPENDREKSIFLNFWLDSLVYMQCF